MINLSIHIYYEHKRNFKKEHPLPIAVLYYGSGDEPVQILTVLETEQEWSTPLEIKPLLAKEENIKLFKDFCKTYLNIDAAEPKWLLSAYYG